MREVTCARSYEQARQAKNIRYRNTSIDVLTTTATFPPLPSVGEAAVIKRERCMSVPNILARVVPICFVVGAGVELFMINVKIGDTSFYNTAIKKEAERRDDALRQRVEFFESQQKQKDITEERRKAA